MTCDIAVEILWCEYTSRNADQYPIGHVYTLGDVFCFFFVKIVISSASSSLIHCCRIVFFVVDMMQKERGEK